MKKFAIKGHPTRGKEVIEILEMFGGKIHRGRFVGHELSCGYYIKVDGYIGFKHYSLFDDTMIFTLEEFLEKFPYKVGDKVNAPCKGCVKTITSMKWDDYLNSVLYKLDDREFTTINLLKVVNELPIIEKETMEKVKDNWAKWDLPDGYEFQDKEGNVINTDTIKLVKKQPQYPKTYEECCDILYIETNRIIEYDDCWGYRDITQYDINLLTQLKCFRRLRICRDAYWKIAGEEMGLGKPWEPDWLNAEQDKYVIFTHNNTICSNRYVLGHNILAFPTEEMRDAFYENFKKEIEQCKELL